MNITAKLDEWINELLAERDEIDRTIAELQAMKKNKSRSQAAQGDSPMQVNKFLEIMPRRNKRSEGSYVALAAAILREQKRPLHVTDLVTRISEIKGAQEGEVTRASVEASLIRALNSPTWRGVLKKTGPGTFSAESN